MEVTILTWIIKLQVILCISILCIYKIHDIFGVYNVFQYTLWLQRKCDNESSYWVSRLKHRFSIEQLLPFTHFSPVSHFYTPWKRRKTKGFMTFSGGIEMWHWTKIGYGNLKSAVYIIIPLIYPLTNFMSLSLSISPEKRKTGFLMFLGCIERD